jgi:hypothetical protein
MEDVVLSTSSSRVRAIPVLGFVVIILLPIFLTAAPWTVNAQEAPEVIGSPAKLSPRQQLLYVMARSPIFASLIEDAGLLETASDVVPSWGRSGEGVAPESPSATQIEYWRYLNVICFVGASSFASLKVDWRQYLYFNSPSSPGDCIFYIEYGAEYTGTTPMPGDKTILDTWKKGMKFTPGQPYMIPPGADAEFDDYNNCVAKGIWWDYTGIVHAVIGATPGEHWRCGRKFTVITKNGLDLSVLSPKPKLSGTVIDVSTGKTVKPESMVPGSWYTLQVETKSFAIKSPALRKQSEFEYAEIVLVASGHHAVSGTGMYVENVDPYTYWSVIGSPPGATDAQANWLGYNNAYGGAGVTPLAPSTPKVIFPPTLMTTAKFQKSDTKIAPNTYDPTANAGELYAAYIDVSYLHKGISFITANDISFSGNPPGVTPIRYDRDVAWYLSLWAAYPDYTYPPAP